MNVKKEAKRDAHELARARMFYGEGAGTRRKLITATVEEKIGRDPNGYGVAFYRSLADQDMAEHAAAARKERRRKDVTESAAKNTKHLLTGNYQNMESKLLVLVAVGYVAHRTGLDKKAYHKGKEMTRKARERFDLWRRGHADVYYITNVQSGKREDA